MGFLGVEFTVLREHESVLSYLLITLHLFIMTLYFYLSL